MELHENSYNVNPLNPELNPICYLLALLGAHHFLHVSRIRVKLLTFRLLMSYIYIYDISRLRVKVILYGKMVTAQLEILTPLFLTAINENENSLR